VDRVRLGLWGVLIFAALSIVGMAVQVYLIGGFLFGETDWLDTHKDVGMLVHLFYVLTFLAALVAYWGNWSAITWPFLLAVVGSIQAFLAGGGDVGGDNGAVHAFHAALVPIVLLIAVYVALRTWRELQARPAAPVERPATGP
jgi:hypothetical protein